MGTEPGFVHEDYGSCNGSGATEQARSRRPSVSWIWLVGTQLEIALVLVLLPSTPPGAFKEGLWRCSGAVDFSRFWKKRIFYIP